MRAAYITTLSAVTVAETDEPAIDPALVQIEVAAAGVSYPDVLLSQGRYQIKPEPPFIPGSEIAGRVRYAPDGSGFSVGQQVAGFPFLGAFAEVVNVDPRLVFPLPPDLSAVRAAAIPMNYLTVHFALLRRGSLQPGETVLVHGAGGGVGTAAVQFAHALGARVIAVVSSDAKAEIARKAGADEVIRVDGFRAQVAELTGGKGVDLIVDPVGGDRFTDSLRSLATEGRLLVLGFTAGEIPTVRVNRLLLNNTAVIGVSWGGYWRTRVDYLGRQWRELLPLIRSGQIDPVIGTVYPLDEVATALTDMAERRTLGKSVLRLTD
ncbi:MAG TPA: NADPH:quinone oxidoreductase family protein [Pseudonocardiaceae bacterium]